MGPSESKLRSYAERFRPIQIPADLLRVASTARHRCLAICGPGLNPVTQSLSLKLCSTSRPQSWLIKASPANCAMLIPCADHSTICGRRQVTIDPRRTIRFRRFPLVNVTPGSGYGTRSGTWLAR